MSPLQRGLLAMMQPHAGLLQPEISVLPLASIYIIPLCQNTLRCYIETHVQNSIAEPRQLQVAELACSNSVWISELDREFPRKVVPASLKGCDVNPPTFQPQPSFLFRSDWRHWTYSLHFSRGFDRSIGPQIALLEYYHPIPKSCAFHLVRHKILVSSKPVAIFSRLDYYITRSNASEEHFGLMGAMRFLPCL
ncbi:hypothetical protein BKA67DRAFT_538003 [Truncatella angustata]|uniref:Uncharacterized protein n=1 Tax=Truncatella angustata TaxID=152316 RepID=A0A9P8ZWP0_9PEZI|nr:uncharacterized protein BKA67DRAFT_538003 [Truncatella angustata]KAH6652173.1 hypothetical protein BKA67DRAFT_538003 [Truncatella angustata]